MKWSIKNLKNEDLGLDNRKIVLKYSLYIEDHVSTFLEMLLKIEPGSKSFGNSSYALSFNAKLLLMFDMDIIDKEERIKLETFMAIRNQFMHNSNCTTFEICIKYLGKEKYLKEIHNFSEEKALEDNYRDAVVALGEMSVNIALKVMEETIRDTKRAAAIITDKNILDAYNYTFRKVLEKADLDKSNSITISELTRIYTEKAEELMKESDKKEYSLKTLKTYDRGFI